MNPIVENQLHFKSNRKTVLAYLKSKCTSDDGLFTLNSIKKTPEQLDIELTKETKQLSILNVNAPEIKGSATGVLLDGLLNGNPSKASPEELSKIIESIQADFKSVERKEADQAAFEKSVTNFENLGFFSCFDWRLSYWGTIDDVSSVDASSFHIKTECIRFETLWSPPLAALNNLANTFPSVKFELLYRYQAEQDWTKIQLFPQVPFGY